MVTRAPDPIPDRPTQPHALLSFEDALVTVVGNVEKDDVFFSVGTLIPGVVAVAGAHGTPVRMLELAAAIERVAGEVMKRRCV